MLQAWAGWGSSVVTLVKSQGGQSRGRLLAVSSSLQHSDYWYALHVGLAAPSCSFLLTCPSGSCSSSCCMGMK